MMLINSVNATPVTLSDLTAREEAAAAKAAKAAAKAAAAKEAARKRHPLIASFRLTNVRNFSHKGVYYHIEATLGGFDVYYTLEEGEDGCPTREDLCLRLRRNPNPGELEGIFRFWDGVWSKGENDTPFDIPALRRAMWREEVAAFLRGDGDELPF